LVISRADSQEPFSFVPFDPKRELCSEDGNANFQVWTFENPMISDVLDMFFSFYWEFNNECFIFPLDSFKYSFSEFTLERKLKRSWLSSNNTSVPPSLIEPELVSAASDNKDPPQIRSEHKVSHLEAHNQLLNFHINGISLSPSLDRAISPIQNWNNLSNVNTECSSVRSNEDQIDISPSQCYSLSVSGSSVPSGNVVKRESPILVPPRLKRTLSLIPSNEQEHQMSVPDTKHPVTPVGLFSQQDLHSIEDNVCISQRAFSDSPIDNSQGNILGSFNFKPPLETPKCSPKRTFKVKILKDDNNVDDSEVQYIGKNPIKDAIKIAEYEGKSFKMRKYHK
jgi:hypothetical protein